MKILFKVYFKNYLNEDVNHLLLSKSENDCINHFWEVSNKNINDFKIVELYKSKILCERL